MAANVFAKLNLKDQREIVVLQGPSSFERELETLDGVRLRRSISGGSRVTFALAFVTSQEEVDRLAPGLATAAEGDAVIWFAYPKGSSKRYTSTINRERGWRILGDAGFEPVRMVAIDEDWSAVRFRRTEFIKALTRGAEHAISAAGKAKAAAGRPRTGTGRRPGTK